MSSSSKHSDKDMAEVSSILDRLDAAMDQIEVNLDDSLRVRTVQAVIGHNSPEIDAIVERTRVVMGVPFVGASLLDDETQQWVASTVPVETCDRDFSYCQYVVGSGQPLLIEDTATHPLARRMRPIMLRDSVIRAYLGVPLLARNGERLGALCAVDTAKPRHWTEPEMNFLAAASAEITRALPE